MYTGSQFRSGTVARILLQILALAAGLNCGMIYESDELEKDHRLMTQAAVDATSRAQYQATSNALATQVEDVHVAETAFALEVEMHTAQTEEAAAAAVPASDAPAAPAPPVAPPDPASSAPIITRVDFPKAIPANGIRFVGWTSFKDPDGDVVLQRMEVVSALSMKGFEDDPRQGLFGSPTDGRYDFKIWCFRKQEITMRVTLVDAAGNSSNSVEFSFECY